jgi:hypothetical protein
MDTNMYHYATVSKALSDLKDKGFTTDFNLKEKDIVTHPDKFEIVHIYRYEGQTDPGDEATVYGIQCKSGEKGVFVASDLSFDENDAAKALHEISIKGRRSQN